MSIECRSARGIRAGEKERERERASETFLRLSSFSSSSSAVRLRPAALAATGWRRALWIRSVPSKALNLCVGAV